MGTEGSGRRLVIIGGGEEEGRMKILREFVRLAGDPEAARIVAMSAASTDHRPQDEKYREAFSRLGVAHHRALESTTRQDADEARSLGVITWTPGIFFTGGDQKRIGALLKGTKADRELHPRLGEGVVITGMSAGASMMCATMMDEGESEECPGSGSPSGPRSSASASARVRR